MNQKFGEYFIRAVLLLGVWTIIVFVFNIGW
jgi:hypothetical protein